MTKSKKWNLVTIYRDVGCENNFEINRKYQKIVEKLDISKIISKQMKNI